MAYGSKEDLKDFVAEPDRFIANREKLPIVASDAVPVYLDIAAGKVLVPATVLDITARRRLAKRKGLPVEELTEDIHLVAEGASRADKDRLTWWCRQVCFHYFAKVKTGEPAGEAGEPAGEPAAKAGEPAVKAGEPASRIYGKMLDSILMTHCGTVVRLEDICPFTDTWLKDQNLTINGKSVVRKKGEKVPLSLMRPWRELRKKHPEMFEQGVRVWGSPNAYQNEVTCSLHSELLEEEFPEGCVHQVDMFAGELTEVVENLNFVRNQVKTVIPPKQTAKVQVTDILYSRIGKAAGNKAKQQLRRDQRRKAKEEGVAAKLEAGCFESLSIVNAMHQRCVESANIGQVEQTFRKAAYLAYEFTDKGMRKAEGERWNNLPLGGSNLTQKYLDLRYGHLDGKGVPEKPDWSEVHELRRKQRESAKDISRIKAQGTKAAFRPKEGEAAKNEEKAKEQQAKEEEILKDEKDDWSEHDNCLGVLSEYLVQTEIDEEAHFEKEPGERLEISLSIWEGLDKGKEDLWMALPPKRRKQILDEARTELVTSQGTSQNKADMKEEAEVFI